MRNWYPPKNISAFGVKIERFSLNMRTAYFLAWNMRVFVSKYAGCIFVSLLVPNLRSAYLLRSKYADSSPMFDVRAKTTISQLFDNEMTCRFDCAKATYWCTYPRNFVTFYRPETSQSLVKVRQIYRARVLRHPRRFIPENMHSAYFDCTKYADHRIIANSAYFIPQNMWSAYFYQTSLS